MKIDIDIKADRWNRYLLHYIYNAGMQIVAKDQHADIYVKQADDVTTADLTSGKSFIVFERADGSEVTHKHLLKHPAVLRYVKRYNYADFQLHNMPCVDSKFFTRALASETDYYYPDILLTEGDYRKIFLGFNFLHTPGKLPFVDNDPYILSESKRELDVFFAGNINFNTNNGMMKSGDLISAHRKNCVDILNTIDDLEVVAVAQRAFEPNVYRTALYNSKVIVSPWGWGEACHRDYEAILAGCILIKPASEFVKSYDNIFNPDFCIWVKPDFSDLEQEIKQALKAWEATKFQRQINRGILMERFHEMPVLIRKIFNI